MGIDNQRAACPALSTAATTAQPVQKTIKPCNALRGAACSDVRARYPQADPQSLGASGKAGSRYPQGFASILKTFSLDPQAPAV
jgi:hypothetical protein